MPNARLGLPLAAALLMIGGPQASALIANGLDAQLKEFPQVVGFEVNDDICTGTAVGPNSVLTAAHCVDGAAPGDVVFHWPGGRVDRGASEILVHPLYDALGNQKLEDEGNALPGLAPNDDQATIERKVSKLKRFLAAFTLKQSSDLALIKLAKPLKRFSPIELRPDSSAFLGSPVTLVGYGCNEIFHLTGPTVQRKASNRLAAVWLDVLFSIGANENRVEVHQRDGTVHLNPDGREGGLCPGDSGGPLLAGDDVIGVNVSVSALSGDELAIKAWAWIFGADEKKLDALPDMHLNWSVSLSRPENSAFLEEAKDRGYQLAFAPLGAGPKGRAPAMPRSQTLRRLAGQGPGVFGR